MARIDSVPQCNPAISWLNKETLSCMTRSLDVTQFSQLRNFVVREKICSERHANVSGRPQKHLLSPQLYGHVARYPLAFVHSNMSPNLAKPLFSLSILGTKHNSSRRTNQINKLDDFARFFIRTCRTDYRCYYECNWWS